MAMMPYTTVTRRKLALLSTALTLCAVPLVHTPALAQNTDDDTLLDTVVITATGFEQTVKDAPASISVIPRAELEKSPFHDLADTLRTVQGVAITGGANTQDIYIRGLPGAYTLILVDGKRQSTRDARTNSTISGFEQSFIPPAAAIERIEVVRGPMSSLYGSDAMGGVINIITRKVPEKWTGSFTLDGTTNQHGRYGDTLQGSYYLAGPLVNNVIGMQLWGRGLNRQEDKIIAGTPEKKEVDMTGRLTITPNENHDIRLEAGHTRLRRFANDSHTLEEGDKDNHNINSRDHWSVSYTGRFDWTTAEFSVLQEIAQRKNYGWIAATEAQPEHYGFNLREPKIRNTVYDGKFTTPFEFRGNHTLVTGGQYIDSHLSDQNPGMRNDTTEKFSIDQWALFGEDEWWLTDDFALTGGIRMDHHGIYGSHWSPRGYAVWHATENVTLKGGVSTGFRAPEIRSIAPGYAYTTGGGGCFYGKNPPAGRSRCGVIVSSPGLQAEKSTSYEFSALWDNLNNLQLGATYFYTDFKDKITNRQVIDADGNQVEWDVDPNYVLWENLNIDKAVMQGVELTGTWRATETLTFRANYTYTDSKQKTGDYKGLPLARTPEHMANIRADWQTPVENLSAWSAANYHGKETNAGLRIGAAGKPISRDGKVIARQYDSYFTFDIGATYNINDNLRMNAAVYNLFDKRIDVDQFNDVVEGRRFWLSLTATF